MLVINHTLDAYNHTLKDMFNESAMLMEPWLANDSKGQFTSMPITCDLQSVMEFVAEEPGGSEFTVEHA